MAPSSGSWLPVTSGAVRVPEHDSASAIRAKPARKVGQICAMPTWNVPIAAASSRLRSGERIPGRVGISAMISSCTITPPVANAKLTAGITRTPRFLRRPATPEREDAECATDPGRSRPCGRPTFSATSRRSDRRRLQRGRSPDHDAPPGHRIFRRRPGARTTRQQDATRSGESGSWGAPDR